MKPYQFLEKKVLLLIIASVFVINLFAQKQIDDAVLKYNITIRKPDQEKKSNNLSKATYQLFVKGSMTKSDFVNNLGIETSIYNNKTEKGVILKEYSGQKLMINLNKEDWMLQNQLFRNLKFNFEDENKIINGTNCKKATAILTNGSQLTVYYDPNNVVANTNYTVAFPSIPGLPVLFENQNKEVIYTYTLNEINYEPVNSVIFEIPKTGYREISYQEALGLKKGN